MLLIVNGIYRGVECPHVGYWINDYESAFELLTQLVTDNWILQDATIMDGLDRLVVPINAIDGEPILAHVRTLQRQWQLILTNSGQSAPSHTLTAQQFRNWHIHLDAYYDDMLQHLTKMIAMLEKKKSLLLARQSDESLRSLANKQYNSLLKSNKRMYRKTQEDRKKNRMRLQDINNEPPID